MLAGSDGQALALLQHMISPGPRQVAPTPTQGEPGAPPGHPQCTGGLQAQRQRTAWGQLPATGRAAAHPVGPSGLLQFQT